SKLSSPYACWLAFTAAESGSRTEEPKQFTTKSWPTFSSRVIFPRVAFTQLFSEPELDAPCADAGKDTAPSNRATPMKATAERRVNGMERMVRMATPGAS